MGKTKAKGKITIAASTDSSPTYSDAFAKQLTKQQQQFDALMGKVQAMVTTLQVTKWSRPHPHFCQGKPFIGNEG